MHWLKIVAIKVGLPFEDLYYLSSIFHFRIKEANVKSEKASKFWTRGLRKIYRTDWSKSWYTFGEEGRSASSNIQCLIKKK